MMSGGGWHVAQVNVAVLAAPLDSSRLESFVALLDPINALADGSPGFVWRLQTEGGDATSIRAFDDDRIIVNLSVWEGVQPLRAFVYASRHAEVFKRRREWFQRMTEVYLALWWIPAGTTPSVDEAKRRLEILRERGPCPEAFTFRRDYPPPEEAKPGISSLPNVSITPAGSSTIE